MSGWNGGRQEGDGRAGEREQRCDEQTPHQDGGDSRSLDRRGTRRLTGLHRHGEALAVALEDLAERMGKVRREIKIIDFDESLGLVPGLVAREREYDALLKEATAAHVWQRTRWGTGACLMD